MDTEPRNVQEFIESSHCSVTVRQGKPPILRLAIDGGGCAGFQYRFGLADAVEAGDTTVVQDGVTLVVDEVSLEIAQY